MVADLPEQAPSASYESTYPFTIVTDDVKEDLLQGYHVKAEILTKEAKDANAVPVKSVVKKEKLKYVWLLNGKGIAEKRKVTTGIKDDGFLQLKSGVKTGVHVAMEPCEIHREDTFVTLFKPQRISWDKDASIEGQWKYLIMGVLEP